MADDIFISICIPAYQRVSFLERLLDSIERQSFHQFEVVITDDSPGTEVRDLVDSHGLKGHIRYFKNPVNLGSPENWNEAIRKSRADWIKIMHDDDWFSSENSLQQFVDAIKKGGGSFYFTAYKSVFPDGGIEKTWISPSSLRALNARPEILMAANRIGPPSTVIFKKDPAVIFDRRMQWLVDIDFYIAYLNKNPPAVFIPFVAVQIGVSESQVTNRSFGKPEIEIPERFMLNEKMNPVVNQTIIVFDSWWRFVRNLSIKDISDIRNAGHTGKIPSFIFSMISTQNKIPRFILKTGPFSKLFMLFHYLRHKGH